MKKLFRFSIPVYSCCFLQRMFTKLYVIYDRFTKGPCTWEIAGSYDTDTGYGIVYFDGPCGTGWRYFSPKIENNPIESVAGIEELYSLYDINGGEGDISDEVLLNGFKVAANFSTDW